MRTWSMSGPRPGRSLPICALALSTSDVVWRMDDDHVVWGLDASLVLRRFARLCALDVVHLWSPPPLVVRYLRTGDHESEAWDALEELGATLTHSHATRAAIAVAIVQPHRAAYHAAAHARRAVGKADGTAARAAACAANPQSALCNVGDGIFSASFAALSAMSTASPGATLNSALKRRNFPCDESSSFRICRAAFASPACNMTCALNQRHCGLLSPKSCR